MRLLSRRDLRSAGFHLAEMYVFFLRLKVARLDNIFLTRMHWSNVGGLCGESLLGVRGWWEVSGNLTWLSAPLLHFSAQGN